MKKYIDVKYREAIFWQNIPAVIIVLLSLCSCSRFLEIAPPQNQIIRSTVFTSDESALSTLAAIYSKMFQEGGFASGRSNGVTYVTGFSSDEFDLGISSRLNEFFDYTLSPISSGSKSLWSSAYSFIYQSNAILEGTKNATSLSSEVRQQLEGEARFIRAFCYFYLVNLFSDVPMVLSTDYRINSNLPREATAKIYDQIVSDLTDATRLLKDDYSTSNGERIKPNRFVALALLARTYLYTGKWQDAEVTATQILEQTKLFDTVAINNIFLKNSKEAIWQLKPVISTINTWEGNTFIWTAANSISISDNLLNAFEQEDIRKTAWVGKFDLNGIEYHYPFKYKIKSGGTPLDEYSMVFRLAEQYLIRAEARAKTGNLEGAKLDINVIRKRAGLADIDTFSAEDLLEAIQQERRIELFAEWGHRWLDLKRTNKADAVLGLGKENWSSFKTFYPIPLSDMDRNPNLRPQNEGY